MNPTNLSKTSNVVSPCVSICEIDPNDGICRGCFRSLGEIAAWQSMSQEAQMLLLEKLRDRRAHSTGLRRRVTKRNLKRSNL